MGTSCCTKRSKDSMLITMDNKFTNSNQLNNYMDTGHNPISFKNFKENDGYISKGNSFDIINNDLLFKYHKEFSHNKEYKEYYKEDQKLHNEKKKIKNQKTVKKLEYPICYIEKKLIGSGSSGTIIKAFDKRNNLTFAVKKIFLGNLNEEEIKIVENEAKIISEIDHKNIVKSYGSKKKTEILEIYFEYIENQSLKDLLKKHKRISEKKTSKYIKQILQALDYLHSKELIHRDIKSENILLNNNNEIKLSDFGSVTNSERENLSVVGTAGFIAPEVLDGKNGHGRSADIWSLGCTVFELLTGNSPFYKSKNLYESAKSILDFSDEYFFFEGKKFGVLAKDFIKCCIKKNPKLRHNSYELLNHPFVKSNENIFYNLSSEEFGVESILKDKKSEGNKFEIKTLNEVSSLYSINNQFNKNKISKRTSNQKEELESNSNTKENIKIEENHHGYLVTLETEYIN